MTAREAVTLDYWNTSRAALSGSMLAATKLNILSEHYRADIEKLANAASNSLTAAAMRSGK